jgi:hypothetical protein
MRTLTFIDQCPFSGVVPLGVLKGDSRKSAVGALGELVLQTGKGKVLHAAVSSNYLCMV